MTGYLTACKIERAESVSELCKEITLLDNTNWIGKAWCDTAPPFPLTDEERDDYER